MVIQDLIAHVDNLLSKKEDQKLKSLLVRQNTRDISQVIERLEHGKRKTFAMLPPELQAEVALLLSERSRSFVLPRLSDHAIARFLHFNNEDDAADLLHELLPERREHVLQYLQEDKRIKVQKLLRFGPETAGGLMDLNFIILPSAMSIKDASDKIRDYITLHKQAPVAIVTNEQGQTLGYMPYRMLMFNTSTKPIGSQLIRFPVVSSGTDQERVLKLATQEKADVIGVKDDGGHLIGIIHLHDLLRVAQMEATEDVYKFAGVSKEEEMLDSAPVAIRLRYHWLIINLATAFMAAFIVSLFESTIAKTAILAAYMPIVAGMGGNAGTQTLAVVVRGLALGEGRKGIVWKIVTKEIIAGLVNGLINGIIVAAVVYIYKGTVEIALILLLSMVINLIVAGIFGALVPLTLRAFKIDPAVAATVFVTTATDIFGFLAFLGLAAIFLR